MTLSVQLPTTVAVIGKRAVVLAYVDASINVAEIAGLPDAAQSAETVMREGSGGLIRGKLVSCKVKSVETKLVVVDG